MSQYTVSVNNNEFLINTVVQDLNLSLSRTGGQGSSGNSVSDAYFDSNDNLIIEVSNAAGVVVQTINLGPVAAVNATSISETCKNVSGGTLAIGTPVYQSGTAGQAMEVQAARADTAASMPAVGVLTSTLADEAEGSLVLTGFVKGFDTSAFSEGDTLYIGATGGLTTTAPPGSGNLIQNIGKVIKVHASNGSVMVTGAGRANATPNLDDGNIFIGNASNQATTASLETEVQAIGDARYVEVAGDTMTGDLSFGDNDKAIFGTGLQIYDSGTASYILGANTGLLVIEGSDLRLRAVDNTNYFRGVDGSATYLYHPDATNGIKLATTSTGVDVTGTITSEGLTVSNNAAGIADAIELENFSGDSSYIKAKRGLTLSADYDNNSAAAQSNIAFETDGSEAMLINGNGDISFYEDTGTTPKFFWDASAESLGIGTSSPAEELHIYSDNSPVVLIEAAADNDSRLRLLTPNDGIGFIEFGDTEDSDTGEIRYEHSTNNMVFSTNGTQGAMLIDSSGNVGIGTSTPTSKLDVHGAGVSTRILDTSTVAQDVGGALDLAAYYTGTSENTFARIEGNKENATDADRRGYFSVKTRSGGSGLIERMRIDSNGKVGIGTDSPEATLTVDGQTILGDSVAGSANLTNLTSGTPPQLIAGFSVPAITWSPSASTEAVFTRDGSMQIDILAGANNFSNINFSDPDDEDVGQLSYDHSTDAMRFRTDNSERMRIDSNGQVGIGTDSPEEKLHVEGNLKVDFGSAGGNPRIYLDHDSATDDGNYLQLNRGDDGLEVVGQDNVKLRTNGAERMRIDSNGNVGIGTDSPAGVLQISATYPTLILDETNTDAAYQQTQFSLDDGSFRIQTRTSTSAYVSNDYLIDKDANGATDHIWRISNVEAMRIDSSGNLDMNGNDIIDVEDIRTSSGTKVFFPRAWVNFNGQSTVSIRDSGNVSSITDLGTGDFRINFTNLYSNASFAASGSSANTVGSSDSFANAYSFATSSVAVGINNILGELTDRTYQTVTTVGNQ